MAPDNDRNKDLSESAYLLEPKEKYPKPHNDNIRRAKKPSTGRKIAVMAACIMLQLICVGVGFSLSVTYAELIVVFDVKRADAALVQSLYMGISTGGGILWNRVVVRIGPGICTMIGTLLGFIGLLASSFATSLTTVIITTGIVASTGMAICYIVPFIAISWLFHDDPGLPLVLITLGSSMGQFIFPFVSEILISAYLWSGSFMIMSAIALNCIPCGILIYCSRDFFITGAADDGNAISKKSPKCDVSLIKDLVINLLLINFFLIALTGNEEAWFLVDIMTLRGYERETGSLLVSLLGFANLLGRMLGAFMRYKCKIPTLYHWMYLLPILGVSHILVIKVKGMELLIASCVLYGATFGITVAQAPAIMFEATGLARYPQGVSLMSLMYGFGNVFGGLLGGSIKDLYGEYDPVFYIAAGANLYIALSTSVNVYLMYWRRRKTEKEPDKYAGHVRYKALSGDTESW